MGRGKVSHTLIQNEAIRRATMKRRREALMKKVNEITTLCGEPGVCLVYCPGEPNPLVWPTHHDEAQKHLNHYFSIPEVERSKKATTQESFLKERLTEERVTQMTMIAKLNSIKEAVLMDEVFHGRGLYGLHSHELDELASLLTEKVVEIKKKRNFYEGGPVQPPPPPLHHGNVEVDDGGAGEEGPNQAGGVVAALQQRTRGGGSAEFVLAQSQQTLNVDAGEEVPNQAGVVALQQQRRTRDFPNPQQPMFRNTFRDSRYEMGQGSGENYIDGANVGMAMVDGDFDPPPSPVVHYHRRGSGLNLEPAAVGYGGRNDQNRVRYHGGQFVGSSFEEGTSSGNPSELLAQGGQVEQPAAVQPQQHIEAYDILGNVMWPPQA